MSDIKLQQFWISAYERLDAGEQQRRHATLLQAQILSPTIGSADFAGAVVRCRAFISLRVPCHSVSLNGCVGAEHVPFSDFIGTLWVDERAHAIQDLFETYLMEGYFDAEKPINLPPLTGMAPLCSYPLEYVVKRGYTHQMVALLRSGINESKVPATASSAAGDFLGFVSQQTHGARDEMLAAATDALMAREIERRSGVPAPVASNQVDMSAPALRARRGLI